MHKTYAHLLNLANHLLPSQCLLCACTLQGELICNGCQCDLPYLNQDDVCQQCCLNLSGGASYCGHCLQHPPAFSRSIIPFAYGLPLAPLIHKLKYRRHLTSGRLLGQLLAEYLTQHAQEDPDWQRPDLVIPTPMHWMGRWRRGFNQADILAGAAAKALDIPLATRLVRRLKRTQSQKELTRAERQRNLRQAFSVENKAAVTGLRVALVDDVVTTTATVREVAQVLIKAGAKDVQVWALARTMDK